MTMNDNWLLERARKRKAAAAQPQQNRSGGLKALPPVDDLWTQLQQETRRQAKVFTDALGDPAAVVIETPPDAIEVSAPDGRRLTLRVDRRQGTLSETLREASGLVRMRKSIIKFSTNADGEVTFNFGGLQAVAGSVLRRLIS